MLFMPPRPLDAETLEALAALQETVSHAQSFEERVFLAADLWKKKNSRTQWRQAFHAVRATLARMCTGPIRCSYCEDSLADEIEHIRPKNLFPDLAFVWENYLFSCGPCNGPKSNRYGHIDKNKVIEYRRVRSAPISPPPSGESALIDPRREDPCAYLELDLGGVTPGGMTLQATYEFMPADPLTTLDLERARFTIDVLGLNREVIRVARGNAFGGFRARLREYVEKKEDSACEKIVKSHRDDLLRTPHLTVFSEMRRQRKALPEIDDLFNRAPEAVEWHLLGER